MQATAVPTIDSWHGRDSPAPIGRITDDHLALAARRFWRRRSSRPLALPALAQDKPTLRFSAVFSDKDIRAQMTQQFAEAIGEDFTFEPYYGGNLFKQGTELVALQRGNLEMGNIAPQDIANQVPEFSIVTSAYLFRDADHMRAFFDSDIGKELTGASRSSSASRSSGRPTSAPARSG